MQDVRILANQARQFLFASFFELFQVFLRDTVPELWLTPVTVVDRKEHQVLVVPAKSGIFHPNIHPRDIYTTNVLFPGELHQTVERVWQIVEIPRVILVGLLVRMDDLLSLSAKAGAELSRGNVSCILDLNKWLDLVVYHVPVLFLNLVVVCGSIALIFSLQTSC